MFIGKFGKNTILYNGNDNAIAITDIYYFDIYANMVILFKNFIINRLEHLVQFEDIFIGNEHPVNTKMKKMKPDMINGKQPLLTLNWSRITEPSLMATNDMSLAYELNNVDKDSDKTMIMKHFNKNDVKSNFQLYFTFVTAALNIDTHIVLGSEPTAVDLQNAWERLQPTRVTETGSADLRIPLPKSLIAYFRYTFGYSEINEETDMKLLRKLKAISPYNVIYTEIESTMIKDFQIEIPIKFSHATAEFNLDVSKYLKVKDTVILSRPVTVTFPMLGMMRLVTPGDFDILQSSNYNKPLETKADDNSSSMFWSDQYIEDRHLVFENMYEYEGKEHYIGATVDFLEMKEVLINDFNVEKELFDFHEWLRNPAYLKPEGHTINTCFQFIVKDLQNINDVAGVTFNLNDLTIGLPLRSKVDDESATVIIKLYINSSLYHDFKKNKHKIM